MATMKDVAKLAGVSHGTVSNVLSGAKGVKIDKINRVEQAIKKLGYKTNALARNLKTNSAHNSIYVVMPNLRDGAFRDMYDGISRNAEKKGYNVNLHLTDELVYREKHVLSHAQMYNIDGAIVISCQPDNVEYFSRLVKTGLDIVFLSREVKGADFVGLNFKNKFVKSIEEQIENGAKRIALITGPKEYSFETLCVE